MLAGSSLKPDSRYHPALLPALCVEGVLASVKCSGSALGIWQCEGKVTERTGREWFGFCPLSLLQCVSGGCLCVCTLVCGYRSVIGVAGKGEGSAQRESGKVKGVVKGRRESVVE